MKYSPKAVLGTRSLLVREMEPLNVITRFALGATMRFAAVIPLREQ
jgi:hypothetical protein